MSPIALSRMLCGFATSLATAPGVVVSEMVAIVVTPFTDADTVEVPAMVPRMMVVRAVPVPSVVALVGLSEIPPPPLALKVTAAPLTACPLASDTFTAKVPTLFFTAPLVVGELETSTFDGGPIFGAEESDPHPAATTSSDAVETARN